MIDLHCHILPGVDDGPATLAESLQMAETAVAGGIRAVVATPHTGNGVYSNGAVAIIDRVNQLNTELAGAGIPLQVFPGAEVQLSLGLVENLRGGAAVTINNSRYILLELPPTLLPDPCKEELFSLLTHGFIPIIAHPERHTYLQRNFDYLADLVQMGALCQVTAQSLLGVFGNYVQAAAEKMLRNRLAHVLASDAHGAEGRVPALESAVAAAARLLGSREKVEQMVTAVPAAIIADNDVYAEAPATREISGAKTPWHTGGKSIFSSISGLWSRA